MLKMEESTSTASRFHVTSKKRKRDGSEEECSSGLATDIPTRGSTSSSDRIGEFNIPREISEWTEENLLALSIVCSYQEETTPLELLRMFSPKYYSHEGNISEYLRVMSNYSLPFFIDDIELFLYEYCDFTNRLDNDIQTISSANANILRHRTSLYDSKDFLATKKNFVKKQELHDWLRRFEMCGLNFGECLYYMVKKRELQGRENCSIQLDPRSECNFRVLFDTFASMFGLKSFYWYEPLMPKKTLQFSFKEVIGKPDILYCQDLECDSSDEIDKMMRVVAVCEVKKQYTEGDQEEARVNRRSESVQTGKRPPHISSQLLGQHGGELLLYYKQSVWKGVIFGLIIQETKVSFTALNMTEAQYKSVVSGKFDKPPSNLIITKAYDFMKKEERKYLIRPFLELAMMQEGKTKKIKCLSGMKSRINLKDHRIKKRERIKNKKGKKKKDPQTLKVRELPQASSAMFFKYNTQLGPPYHILMDTNFINFSIKNKLDIVQSMMDCLYAKCIPYITDCVMGELEKLGSKYRVALRIAKDPRFVRLPCLHKGTYADDCLVQRITQHKCYIVATCDKDLKRRIRKAPGVPIMFIKQHRFSIERMPDAFGAPRT